MALWTLIYTSWELQMLLADSACENQIWAYPKMAAVRPLVF